jgi:beta-glucosidase
MRKPNNKSDKYHLMAIELVNKMTLEEKASQLKYNSPSIERLGINDYNWWNESLHGIARSGTATMFPQAIGLSATFDTELLYRVADAISTEARAKYNQSVKYNDRGIYKGLTMWSPNINIFRDPRWGRGQETYGECPYLTSNLALAYINGLQGDKEILKVAGTAKHFACHSGPESIRHSFNAQVSLKDMNETYLPSFETLVKKGKVESVMGAYNRINGEAACASKYLINKLSEWNFDGYFVSDCWAIRDFHTSHNLTTTIEESAALALKHRCDCNCGDSYEHLVLAYEQGLIEENDITESAKRLIRTRARLGMFDEYCEYDSIGYEVVSCDKHKNLSLESAQKSMVLLKNNGLLPLNKNVIKSIAVIGPNANSIDALRGNYYGNADEYITFLDGIRNEFNGRVYYSQGCHLFKDSIQPLGEINDGISEALTVASLSEVVILCLGLDATIEGEEGDTGNAFASGDKTDLLLPKSQRTLVKRILEMNKPTIIVLAAGSSLNPLGELADSIIQAWYPGQMGGKALADIIFGKISPSGKLPVTFYEKSEKLPEFTDYSMINRTYRYLEGNVLYPFGFGLTYSNVKLSDLYFDKSTLSGSFNIKNEGNYNIDEVLQIYIKNESSTFAVKNYSLCWFKRVNIMIEEELKVDFSLSVESLSVVNDNGLREYNNDIYSLFVGVSQPDELSLLLSGVKSLSTRFEVSLNIM